MLLQTPGARADDDAAPLSVTVAFGAGMNTAIGINPANHHVIPGTIRVRAGGVVSFAVSGLHQIFVYNPGKKVKDVVPNPDVTSFFVNDLTGLYYRGILPAGGPPANPVTTNPSNAVNRIESVSFTTPGRYLVICNVVPHFNDGMWAWIVVTGDDDHGHHHDD
jgi:plastocyanin